MQILDGLNHEDILELALRDLRDADGQLYAEHDSSSEDGLNVHDGGNNTRRRQYSFGMLEKIVGTDLCFLDGQFRQLSNNLAGRMGNHNWKTDRRLISDVIRCDSEENFEEIWRDIKGQVKHLTGDFLMLTSDFGKSHAHVLHDCCFTRNTCRCRFTKGESYQTFKNRHRSDHRGRPFIGSLGYDKFRNIILYYLFQQGDGSRQDRCYVLFAGGTEKFDCQDNYLRWLRIQEEWFREKKYVETPQGGTSADLQQRDEHSIDGLFEQVEKPRVRRSAVQRRSKFEIIYQLLSAFLTMNICIPVESALKCRFLNGWDFKFADPLNKNFIANSINLIKTDFLNYELSQFKIMFENANCLFRNLGSNVFTDHYLDRETSLEKLDNLLVHQYPNVDDRKCFLESVLSWFNKKGAVYEQPNGSYLSNLKVQTIIVIGPPNSGKTYFWTAVADLGINVGQFARIANRTNAFSMQDIVDRRIIMGNEMNIEDGAIEDLKKICEGAPCNIRVKNMPDANFTRTPIVITTNDSNFILSVHPHFTDIRTKTYHWSSLSYVEEDLKAAYPLAVFDLFNKYNIGM